MSEEHQVIFNEIFSKLSAANENTLKNAESVLGAVIVHEREYGPISSNFTGDPLELKRIAGNMLNQYKELGWVSQNLEVGASSEVKTRQLVQGVEISAYAGLDTAGSNRIISEVLTSMVEENGLSLEDTVAISFSGNSPALGVTYLGILAK